MLDIRDTEEFEQGHIEEASNISRGTLEMRAHKEMPDKGTLVIWLLCGRQSWCAGRRQAPEDGLRERGFHQGRAESLPRSN